MQMDADAHQLEVHGQEDADESEDCREQPAEGVQPRRQYREPRRLVHAADTPLIRQCRYVYCV